MKRGITVAGGIQGQNLPELMPGLPEKIEEAIGVVSEITHSMGAGERGRMKQNATASWESHEESKPIIILIGERFW